MSSQNALHPPKGSEPEYMGQHLSEVLAQDPRVGELGLKVVVDAGGATATGTVTTEARRQAVATVISEVMPGAQVKNDVRVTPRDQPAVERAQ